MRSALALFVVGACFVPRAARADSDGYYCVGRGYVAYEFRFSQPPQRHLLYVVLLSHGSGFTQLAPIPLDDFQVHGMRCGSARVELDAWNSSYVVDFATPHRPTVTSRPKSPGAGPVEPSNLAHWAKPGVTDLADSAGARGEFQLVIAQVSRPVSGGLEHFTLTDLIQREVPHGSTAVRASLRLFSGVFLETVD